MSENVSSYQTFAEFYANGTYAPYVNSLHLATGSLSAFEAWQPSGPLCGPATPSLTVVHALTDGRFGKCNFGAGIIRDRRYSKGEFIVIPVGMPTNIVLEDVNRTRVFDLRLDLIGPIFEESGFAPGNFDLGGLHMSMTSDHTAVALLEYIWSEAARGDLAWGLSVDSAAIALAGVLLRARQRTERIPTRPEQRGCDWRVRRIIARLDADLPEDMRLVDLAADVNLSASHLIAIFRHETGLSPHRWLLRRRIHKAAEMLKTTDGTVTEISLSCGFASSQHFASVFRKHVGCTPTQFRQDCAR